VIKRIIRDTFVCFATVRQEARLEDALKKGKTRAEELITSK